MKNKTKAMERTMTKKSSRVPCLWNKIFEKAPVFFQTLFCLYIVISLILAVFIDKSLNTHYTPNTLPVSNAALIFPSVLLLAGFAAFAAAWTARKEKSANKAISDRRFYLILGLVFAAVFCVQLFISDHIYFKTGWDVSFLTDTAWQLAFSPTEELAEHCLQYFSTYPNNLTMLYTLTALFRAGGILFPGNPYLFVVIVTNFFVCVSVFLCTLCIYKLSNNRCITVMGMGTGIFFLALSPWIVIPYTDSFGMLFPAVCLFCYLFIENVIPRYFLVSFFCVLGYFFKPTILIFLMALILLKSCRAIAKLIKKEFSIRRFAYFILALFLGVSAAWAADRVILAQNHLTLDTNRQKTMAHYWMMGLNPETEGGFNGDDVAFSDSFPTVEQRREANLEEAKKRLQKMGPWGLIKHLMKKNLYTYNNGTFGFGREGSFYKEVPAENHPLDGILRDIFYTTGKKHPLYAGMEQIIWLFVLLSICFCLIPSQDRRQEEALIALTLLGVSLFLLLFECRARYLFLFTPLYLVLAFQGVQRAANLYGNRKQIFHRFICKIRSLFRNKESCKARFSACGGSLLRHNSSPLRK